MPNGEREYTDMQVQELSLLRKYPVKQPEMIVNYVTTQGTPSEMTTGIKTPERLCPFKDQAINMKPYGRTSSF